MINVFKKIWDFAADEQGNIKKSMGLGLLYAIFHALQLYAIFAVLSALVQGTAGRTTALVAAGLMLVSIAGKTVTQYVSQLQRVHAGYFMAAGKRIQIGDKLKAVPMGYFNQNSLGDITGVSTTTLSDVETTAPVVLVTTLGGFLNALVFALVILLFDWRIGLLVILGMLLFLWVTSRMEKKSRTNAPRRQAAQEALVAAALETIQGMSVVKAFHLSRDRNRRMEDAIDRSCQENCGMEKAMSPYLWLQSVVLDGASVGIMLLSVWFFLQGTMELSYCLMMLVASFVIFGELKSAGSGMAALRLTEASIDRANQLDRVPVMEEGSETQAPPEHSIEFREVSFAYEKRPILENVSFTIPDRTMTAIVGPSGSGKTTICNLMARFWDVGSGSVRIGGRDVRSCTLEQLMSNISMVFQNVYLFADTIENNIRFGRPDATHEEVVEAARRACCDDFISALPEGYQTRIGEGGASLSGGEKQRISIARAMLKDAPIVIFDEATANVDPENEDRLQAAMEALTRDKTIVMIAHRLKTVRHADQILVVDDGRIVQRGRHEELIRQSGIYADFVTGRKQANGWKLG